MKVLLTGASSFSGSWFARTLVSKGHEVTVTFTSSEEAYQGLRAQRIQRLKPSCEVVWNAAFGSPRFVDLLDANRFDILCAHGAYVHDYRSEEFPVGVALQSNTNNLQQVLRSAKDRGLAKLVLTGSVFEAEEGLGERPLRAFSPYGLSKTLTS